MSNIPEENNAALAKRRAIQELMRDKSITGAERNKRMQEIMMGKNVNQLPSAEVDTALESLSDAAATTNSSSSSPPTRQMPRRGSSAKELIAKFESASKNDEPISSSINSSGKSSTIKSSEGSEYHKGATSSLYSRFGSNSNDSDSGVGGGRTSSKATMDQLEQKIKSKNASTSSSSRSVESSPSDRDFEARLRRKASQESLDSSSQPSSKPGATSSASNSDFEARLRRKSQESIDGSSQSSSKPGAVNESKDSAAMSGFQSRILKKSTSNDSLGSSGSQQSSNRGDTLEQRIMAKSALDKSTSRNNYAASSSSSIPRHKRSNSQDSNSSSRSGRSYSDQLEQRIMEKTRNNGPGSTSRTMPNENASSQRFEQRIRSQNDLTSDLNESSRSIDSNGSFENRLRTKLTSSRTLGLSGGDESSSKISSEGGENNSQSRKRKAIKAIMQDESLTPSERNSRLQSVMRGDWIDNDADRQSSYGRQESDMSAEDDADKIRKRALEAKIACKMKKRGEEDGQLNGNDSSSEGGEEDDDYQDSRPSLFAVDDDSSRIHGQNSPSNQSHDGVGYGSLPLPEEHFVSDRQDPFPNHSSPLDNEEQMLHPGQIQDPNDENFGLAVASAVAHDDEPEYVYNAIEYDPDAKPPLHLNRRFRIYTYLALGLIAVVVVLMTIYVTGKSKKAELNNINIYVETSPSISPSLSPITDRERSGVIEQLEGGILERNITFSSMNKSDPRLIALDWILHTDDLQLESDDKNLYQRYVLALLAFSLDSPAWYLCGNPNENYTTNECTLTYSDNSTATFGTWLSSTSECTWFGVTCSADGVVRGVDLNYNDLIGSIPAEISGLAFLQLLHLPNNCIYGTMPPEIGKLRHLMSLELHGNGLSGSMPDEVYNLEKLQLLNLADQWGIQRKCNKTDGTVVDINYSMGGLTRPKKENAGLTGTLGSKLSIWRSMKGLYLNKNSFDGIIPEEIGALRYLRYLWLHDNFIEGTIPSTITKLRNLKHLRLGENFLMSSFPSEFGRLGDMEILEVNGNSMFGEIPQGLYKMSNLEVLRLDDTLMNEAPWLVVPDEGMTGSISTFIGALQDLRWLLISNNPMTGTIPTELGLCDKLEVVRLHRTQISGEMPIEVCRLRDKSLNSATGRTGVLYADCRPNDKTGDPFLKCDCCSDCCDHTTGVCIADD